MDVAEKLHRRNLMFMNAKYSLEIERIVNMCKMPEEVATGLLSSAILYATGKCDLENFANAIANTRAMLPEDFQDAHGLLVGWLDEVNQATDDGKAESQNELLEACKVAFAHVSPAMQPGIYKQLQSAIDNARSPTR